MKYFNSNMTKIYSNLGLSYNFLSILHHNNKLRTFYYQILKLIFMIHLIRISRLILHLFYDGTLLTGNILKQNII